MSHFKLSERSLDNLQGVHIGLQLVVKRAIEITKVDFGVIEGVRQEWRQKELFDAKATKTMDSRHLTGDAVDLMAYVGTRASWELNLYDDIADAMKQAAIEYEVRIRWGGAWQVPDLRKWVATMQAAQDAYIKLRQTQGRRPFIDGPHFERIVIPPKLVDFFLK